MEEKKYNNHIYKHPIVAGNFGPKIEFTGERDFGSKLKGSDLSLTHLLLPLYFFNFFLYSQ